VGALQIQLYLGKASAHGVAGRFGRTLGANQLATKARGLQPDAGCLATRASGRVLIPREGLTQRSIHPAKRL